MSDKAFKTLILISGQKFGLVRKKDIADKIGSTSQKMTNWQSRGLPTSEYENISKKLGITVDELISSSYKPGLVMEDPNAYIVQATEVPLIDMVAAGDWTECVDPYPVGHGVETRLCPVRHGENTFAVRINGESMMPRFRHGDIIFCDPSQQAVNGDFIIAKLTDDNQATFKQLIIEDGKHFLKAINPVWPNPFISINGNAHIVGKVIAKIETF